jgi:hypothetical protein
VTAVVDADASRARATARAFAADYLALENYVKALRRLGFADDDLTGSGSDRLLDAVVVQGDIGVVAARIGEHLEAGADHVCVQLRSPDPADLAVQTHAELSAELRK